MKLEERIKEIIKRLKKAYPDAKVALRFGNPLEILIATILSAQCTDERVNKVTSQLFKKYKSVKDYAYADLNEFEKEIKSTGFYHNKAKNIIACCRMIIDEFNSKVPNKMEDLLKLPGVARKTANIVLYNGYGIIKGIAVDTHVKRLSQKLGLTKNKDANKIEKDLMGIIPKKEWGIVSYLLIEHGRAVCDAKKPRCKECILFDLCLSMEKIK
jgi:endonuclease-3